LVSDKPSAKAFATAPDQTAKRRMLEVFTDVILYYD
jgi:hypothetical protein